MGLLEHPRREACSPSSVQGALIAMAHEVLRALHLGSVQVILTLGVVLAQIINIATGKYYPWGWRVSLGLAGLPAIVLTIGGIVLPDTPNSLVERGFEAEGRKVRASSAAALAQTGISSQLQSMLNRLQTVGRKTPAAADGLHYCYSTACWQLLSRVSERATPFNTCWEAAGPNNAPR